MTPELLEAIRKRNKLKRLYNKSKCLLDWDRYKIQRNVASSLRRKAVSNYFRTTAANAKGNPKKFWQTVKPFMHSKKNISRDSIHLKEGDSLVVNKLEVAQIFSVHFSSFLNDNDSDGHHNDIFRFTSHPGISAIQTHCSAEEAFQFRSVCPPEVELILKSLDPKKAAGYDKIPPRTLRDGADALAYPLSVLINKIIVSGSVPAAWKLAENCPIFKKDDPHDKSNYRPVSIIVTLDKVFEKCLARQLSDYFSSILSPFLSGYRRGYSCEAVLLRLIEDWRNALDNKCVVGAVSMNLSKAFDMIPHDLLLAKLAAYGVAPVSLPLLHSYLRDRSQRVRIEDVTSDVVVFSKGVPQGSVLGPLLFNIFLNDLFYFINRANLSNYADDNQIYFSDRDPEVVKSVINGDLAVASRWFDDNKLVLNPEKCKCIILPKNYPWDLSFSISDVQVPIVDHLELLGVTIDNSLNFSKHIGKITKKVGNQLDVLSRLKNTLSISSKMCLYNSYVMAYFTYCSAIWNNCNESDKQKLERLNVRALRCVYNKRVPLHGDDDYGLTLSNRRLQDIAILIFKAVNGMLPGYISDLFVVRKNVKCLRGTNKLVVPRKKTSHFGLKSTTFIGAKVWNSLPDKLRSTKILKEFKKAARELHL